MTGFVFGSRIKAMAIEAAISMKSAFRLVRRIQIAMLAGIALYLLMGEKLAPRVSGYSAITLLHALSLVSISLVGATVVVRNTDTGIDRSTRIAIRSSKSLSGATTARCGMSAPFASPTWRSTKTSSWTRTAS